jgi:putative acetyltransferase
MQVRRATPDDFAAIHAVESEAFGRPDEANLVDRLRASGDMLLELVADGENGRLDGHLAFSRLSTEPADGSRLAALAPVAVRPDAQGKGVGSGLIRAGLERLGRSGVGAAIVLGEPAYYARFGFSAEGVRSIRAPFSGPAFMGLELEAGALSSVQAIRYADAFGV